MAKKQTKKYVQIIIISCLILMLGLSIIFTSAISKNIKHLLNKADIIVLEDDMIVHFIDVGQGDAISINFPNDKIMLIDAGPKDSKNILVKYLKQEVLKGSNDLTIDYVLLTHSDIDHAGGMSAVFSEFEVKNFFRPNIASNSESVEDFAIKSITEEYDELIKLSKDEDDLSINVVNQEFKFNIGEAIVEILPPIKTYSSTNEMSCITKVTYKGKSFLFAGDIENDSQTDIINYYGKRLDADVLKVAHHGGKTSTSQEFVDVVSPQYSIICVGANSYGHPHFSTIEILESAGSKIYTTLDGDVRFVCGSNMFGVLNHTKTYSYEFVNWWVIALACMPLLIYRLIKLVILMVAEHKEKNKELV